MRLDWWLEGRDGAGTPGRGGLWCGRRGVSGSRVRRLGSFLAILGMLGLCIGVSGCGSEVAGDEVFADLAAAVSPMPVYAPAELPKGVTLAEEWWPVVDLETPADYDGPVAENPWISGSADSEPEIQVLLDCADGWLAILENFRGDLGDVSGAEVGAVAGNSAHLYDVNGGTLVQWSDGGLWYGVFGRGVASEKVIEMALGMRRVEIRAE